MIALASLFLAYLPIQDAPLVRRSELMPAPTPSTMGEMRIYDLGSITGHEQLVQLASEFGPSSDRLYLDRSFTQFEELERVRANANQLTKYLLTTIRELIAPPLAPNSQAFEHVDRGRFALLADAEQHRWLESFVLAAEEFTGLIKVELKIYSYVPDRLPGLNDLQSGSVVTDATAEELINRLIAAECEAISSPKIISNPYQESNLSLINKVAYVKDYEIKVLPGLENEVLDPVIETLRSGLALKIRGVPLPDHQLHIFVNLDISKLTLPIPSVEVVIGDARQKVWIQLPEVERSLVQGHYTVTPGETILLKNTDLTSGRALLVFLKSSRVARNVDKRKWPR
ncbi:MAG: hypothetical protein ACI8TQ_004111 [Planctomycetota bacterium]|jgi:hypothetical protein